MNAILSRDVDSPLNETRIPREKGWRPSRRQTWVAVALSLVMVVVLAGWAKAVATPPNLRFTNIALFPLNPADGSAIHNRDNRLGREVELDFVRAGRFTVLLDLENHGRRAVHLKALPGDGDLENAAYASRVLERDERRPDYADTPFRPLRLSAGDAITVRFDFRFPDCALPGREGLLSPPRITALPVTYTKLGFRRTRLVPLEASMLSMFVAGSCQQPNG
jgi:hypothetical protein